MMPPPQSDTLLAWPAGRGSCCSLSSRLAAMDEVCVAQRVAPLQARLGERAQETAEAKLLFSLRPGQKWMAFAAFPRRKP